MQPFRRLLSSGHRNPSIWGANGDLSASCLSPRRRPTAIPLKPVFTRHGLSNFCIKHHNGIMESDASSSWWAKLIIHRKWMHNLSLSGRNLCVGSFVGISAIAGSINLLPNVAYAMNACPFETGHLKEDLSDSEDPSDIMKQDLETVWELTKKFQLPAVFLLTVLFGWHHPIILAVNVTLILFCTRPNPFSVYIFIEQLRRRSMCQKPGLYKTKFLYVKKVEVEDYKLFCFANVDVSDAKLRLIGILGSWWILQYS